MKIALVCGDGLPVSGLLTVFRNVVGIAESDDLIQTPITADLGYSWRPDKAAFFPDGPTSPRYPDFLAVRTDVPVRREGLAEELLDLRAQIARYDSLDEGQRTALVPRIEAIAAPYESYFADWFESEDVDWVIAVNMTLSDAVPVTLALHRAAARRWADGRPGGVLFWDHDLFGSYAVRESEERVYPEAPHQLTPVPGTGPCHLWAVVTEELAKEAAGYSGPQTTPLVIPNPLPAVPEPGLDDRQRAFLSDWQMDPARPVVLVPVRIFHVKGVEIAVELLREVHSVCRDRAEPPPYLLVFGSLDEEPDYAAAVVEAVGHAGLAGSVRFLDGVPLGSHRDPAGSWNLDEADLLGICAATNGGVFFTPNCPDVESVGLGPALAAVAGVPCAATSFTALHSVYGTEYRFALVDSSRRLRAAAEDFVDLLTGNRDGDEAVRSALRRNRELVLDRFPDAPWRELLIRMAVGVEPDRRRAIEGRPDRTRRGATEQSIGIVTLSDAERAQAERMIDRLIAEYDGARASEVAAHIGEWGASLPETVRGPLRELRYGESLAGVVVRGGPPSPAEPTPRHWRDHDGAGTLRHDMWLLLLTAQLGDLVCWSTLQDGRLVADVLPVAGHEDAQTGHGSRAELEFHVEDAFDDDRCDAFALACLRNPDAVPTTVASTACLDLAALDVEALTSARFRIAADPEHLRGLPPGRSIAPRTRAVLTDATTDPRLRVDPAFTEAVDGDQRAAAAFADLCGQLRAGMVDVVLAPGDVLLLDNQRSVHGRRPFKPRYDGTDRWLRKASVLRDIRRTRWRRPSADSRILLPR